VHDVAVAPHVHELDDVDRAGAADPLEVVAAEVDEHDVLGALLGVGEQLVGEATSSSGVLPRGRDPAIGWVIARSPVTRTSASGEAADDVVRGPVGVREAEEVHVRAGVARPQGPVDVERVGRAVEAEPLADDDLEDLAGADVLLGELDDLLVALTGGVRSR
jgi:hypothetical protein